MVDGTRVELKPIICVRKVPTFGIDLLGVIYRRVPLTHEIFHEELCAIKCLGL